ncbi:galanin receptor type 3 isoform X2 [Fukomys damarensis]|uniref:galanin receptor type 3 isoform X2 n=2 Tax=Fukomys damarensis TaxID=885580 RepID=UPI001454F246|nr:galanin receptor type 3 isoform X2 [Fukomys damarensis]
MTGAKFPRKTGSAPSHPNMQMRCAGGLAVPADGEMADAQNISLDNPGNVGAVAVPVVFALIFLLGTVGNGLVLAVLLQPGPSAWQEPGSTTDLFILNLAVADLCFILCCVPFQAAIYTLDAWLFGALVCKAVHLLIYLTMYASSFTLAAVSVDRCAGPSWGGKSWTHPLEGQVGGREGKLPGPLGSIGHAYRGHPAHYQIPEGTSVSQSPHHLAHSRCSVSIK